MSFADSITSLHGMVALLAALRLRDQTGVGQRVEVAMIDAWLVTDDYVHWALDGVSQPGPQGGEIWDATGGPLMVNQHLSMFWRTLSDAYGLRSDEPENAELAVKVVHRRAAIARWFAGFKKRSELLAAMERVHAAWGHVRREPEGLETQPGTERGVVVEVDRRRRRKAPPDRLTLPLPRPRPRVRAGARGAPTTARHSPTGSDLGSAALDELERFGVLRADTRGRRERMSDSR